MPVILFLRQRKEQRTGMIICQPGMQDSQNPTDKKRLSDMNCMERNNGCNKKMTGMATCLL